MICLVITIYCLLTTQMDASKHCNTDESFVEDKYYNECEPKFREHIEQDKCGIEKNDDSVMNLFEASQRCQQTDNYSDSFSDNLSDNVSDKGSDEFSGEDQERRQLSQIEKAPLESSSVCPWDYKVDRRVDVYPFYRKKAFCQNADSLDYGCEQIIQKMPIVKRGECQDNGLFEWTCDTENVSVGCTFSETKGENVEEKEKKKEEEEEKGEEEEEEEEEEEPNIYRRSVP